MYKVRLSEFWSYTGTVSSIVSTATLSNKLATVSMTRDFMGVNDVVLEAASALPKLPFIGEDDVNKVTQFYASLFD